MFKWGFDIEKSSVLINKNTLMQQTATVKDHIFCHFQKVLSVLLWKYLSAWKLSVHYPPYYLQKSGKPKVISISQPKTEKRKEDCWPVGLSLT